MPYIGHSPTQAGTFYIIDDLTMSSSTGYNMQVGGVDVTPNVDNLLITLDGVVQHPSDAYTVSGSTLTFASGPGSGVDFFGIIMGQSASFGEGSIGADELKVTGDGSSGQVLASDGDGTFTWTTDTENYLPLAGGTMSGAINLGSQNVTNGGTITGTFVGGITGNVTGNASGTALTVTQAAQTSITRVGSSLGVGLAPTHNFNLLGTGTVEARFYSSDGDCQLQIASDTDQTHDSILNFLSGSSGRGQIIYDHHDTAASQKMVFKTGDAAVTAMTIDGAGNVGIGETSPLSKLHVKSADSGASVSSDSDEFVIEGSGHTGMTIIGGTAHSLTMSFGDSGDNNIGYINYDNGSNAMNFATNATTALAIDSSQNATFAGGLTVHGDAHINDDNTDGRIYISSRGTGDAGHFIRGSDQNLSLNAGGSTGQFRFEINGGAWLSTDSSGNATFSGTNCTMKIDATNHAALQIDRASASYDSGVHWQTAGTTKWRLGQMEADGFLQIRDEAGDDHTHMVWKTGGSVGIGTADPARQLHLYHSSSHAYYRLESGAASNYWDILALTDDLFKIENASGNRFQIADNGVITIAAGTVTSDERLKENISDIANSLTVVNSLRGRTFEWIDDKMPSGTQYGVIAQELESVIPDLVSNNGLVDIDESPCKSANVFGIIPILIEAVKELSAKVEALENA